MPGERVCLNFRGMRRRNLPLLLIAHACLAACAHSATIAPSPSAEALVDALAKAAVATPTSLAEPTRIIELTAGREIKPNGVVRRIEPSRARGIATGTSVSNIAWIDFFADGRPASTSTVEIEFRPGKGLLYDQLNPLLASWNGKWVFPAGAFPHGPPPGVDVAFSRASFYCEEKGVGRAVAVDYDRDGRAVRIAFTAQVDPEFEGFDRDDPPHLRMGIVQVSSLDNRFRAAREDLERYYPDRALALEKEGDAHLTCSEFEGRLQDCKATSLQTDLGFERAATRLVTVVHLREGSSSGTGSVELDVSFRLEPKIRRDCPALRGQTGAVLQRPTPAHRRR